jgi:hypothetical protein
MALASLGTALQGTHKSSSTVAQFALTSNINTGDAVLLVVVTDNVDTTDGETSLHTALRLKQDASNSQSCTKVAEYTNGQGAAAAGVTVSVWKVIADRNFTTASFDEVELDTASAVVAKAVAGWRFSIGAGASLDVVTYSTLAQDNTTPGSMSTSGLTSEEHLHLRAIGLEAVTNTFTPTTNFTAMTTGTTANTSGGSGATNVGVRGEFRINTSTGETSDPNYAASADLANIFVAFREGAAGTPHTVSPADNLGITDSISFVIGHARTFNDGLGITDDEALVAATIRQIDDALGITDSAAAGLSFEKTLPDSLGITDANARESGKTVTQDDALGITDATALDRGLTQADALGITDARAIDQSKVLADALGITDAAATSVGYATTVADTLGITDSADAQIVLLIAVDDTLGITDAVRHDRTLELAEALGLTDAAATTSSIVRSVADALGVTDAQVLDQGRALAESLGITDSVFAQLGGGVLPDICEPTFLLIADPGFTADILDAVHLAELTDHPVTAELEDTEPSLDTGCPE